MANALFIDVSPIVTQEFRCSLLLKDVIHREYHVCVFSYQVYQTSSETA